MINNDSMVESPVSNGFSTSLGALIMGLVFLLGVPGNLFIVWSILARTRHRSVTTILILNLACADGFLMALTIFFIVYLSKQTWVFGLPMCKALFYLCNSNMYASIFLITLMSVNRMVAVLFPTKVFSWASKKIVKREIAIMWLLVMVISVPSLVFRDTMVIRDEMNITKLVCAPNHTLPRYVSSPWLHLKIILLSICCLDSLVSAAATTQQLSLNLSISLSAGEASVHPGNSGRIHSSLHCHHHQLRPHPEASEANQVQPESPKREAHPGYRGDVWHLLAAVPHCQHGAGVLGCVHCMSCVRLTELLFKPCFVLSKVAAQWYEDASPTKKE